MYWDLKMYVKLFFSESNFRYKPLLKKLVFVGGTLLRRREETTESRAHTLFWKFCAELSHYYGIKSTRWGITL